MSAGISNNGTRGHATTATRINHAPILAQTRLDNQGQIRQKTPSGQEKEKQAECEKETGLADAKRPITAQPTTRGTATEPEAFTHEEIRDMPGQEITEVEGGKLYLERTLLTILGAPWTIEAMAMAILQVTQYKGMSRQATNTLRSIALVMEQLDDDARGDRVADQVEERLAVEESMLVERMKEAVALVDKAAETAKEAVHTSQKITEKMETAI